MLQKFPKLLLILLGVLFILNILQANFTELIYDEAYYWNYAQNMAWGYFDHPPMVALLIKISSFFFNGELGVRFVSCILSVGTFLLLWLLIDNPKKRDHIVLFVLFGLSMTLINAYGFLTLPDTPIVFFTCAFLLIYKKFLKKPSYGIATVLGVLIAALMYSKDPAILIVFFVILSNLKLVTNKYAWVAAAIALLCYTPHFLWLVEQDFISLKYHLFERPKSPYSFEKYTLAFFLNLVTILGFTFPWVYKALFKTKATDTFTRSLLYITYGIVFFFFISSFNRRVQTQWMIVICIPLFLMAFNYMLQNENAKKWIYRMAIVNVIILSILRVGLIYKPLFPIYYESHGNVFWTNNIKSQIGDTPVVFENTYRYASMYSFYTKTPSFSLNNAFYRQNQYSIDNSEDFVQHQKVLYVSRYFTEGDIDFKRIDGRTRYGKFIDNFESYRKLRCYIKEEVNSIDTEKTLSLQVYNPYQENIPLKKLEFAIAYLNKYKKIKDLIPITPKAIHNDSLFLKSNDTTDFTFKLPSPKMENPRYFRFAISENGLRHGLNSTNIKLK